MTTTKTKTQQKSFKRPQRRRKIAQPVRHAIATHERKVHSFLEHHAHYLGGVVAGLFVAGRGQDFSNPVKEAHIGRRPVFLTLEVQENGGLIFSGAISRPKKGRMQWSPVFHYDAAAKMTPFGGVAGEVPANNLALSRRCIELLFALNAYGRRVSFNMAEELKPVVLPQPIRVKGDIVAEDYTNCLGLEVENPAFGLVGEDLEVSLPNPANKILARLGVEFPMGMPHADLDDAVKMLQSELPQLGLSWSEAAEALLLQHPWVKAKINYSLALNTVPDQVVTAIRSRLPRFAKYEATYSDLMQAAQDPTDNLYLSRLARVQLFPVETAFDLPEDHSGSFLRKTEIVSSH